jgi:GNAT superfamily N-acetyltransferase
MTTSSPQPEMRQARREDLDAIKVLLADDPFSIGREGDADEAVAAAFDEIEADRNSTLFVLERDGRPIGCAQLTVIPGLARRGLKRGLIEAVRIASDLRGQGLGRDFIRRLVEEARTRGCGVVQLTSDKRRHDAHRFYVSLGFAMSHEGFKLDLER